MVCFSRTEPKATQSGFAVSRGFHLDSEPNSEPSPARPCGFWIKQGEKNSNNPPLFD